MPGPGNANVKSLDALKDVRLSLIAFRERVDSAFGDLRAKIDRTLQWLQQDRPLYWREQERKAYDNVSTTRIAYETCRLKTVGGRHPECIEEKVAHQRAKVRLEYCKQKIEVVRKWTVEAGRQADEYRGRVGPLQRRLDEELPNVIAMVTRMIDALEAYAEIHADKSAQSVSLGHDSDDSELDEESRTDDKDVPEVDDDDAAPGISTSNP